jgi:hypothetical protein
VTELPFWQDAGAHVPPLFVAMHGPTPAHVARQQGLCAVHVPLLHWLGPPQVSPSIFFGPHVGAVQKLPALQSPSTEQLILQAVESQLYSPHGVIAP